MFCAAVPLSFAGTSALNMELQASQVRLKTSFVCMMNDAFMGVEQIPVEVGGKTYYGCCQSCKSALVNDVSVRTAVDPYTGNAVDKAEAFIVKEPGSAKQVLYFESEESFRKYSEKLLGLSE
jgi:YHS domain-containing protein